MNLDEKWNLVKAHYEKAYQHPDSKQMIRFRHRLSDLQIEFLFQKLKQLDEDFVINFKKSNSRFGPKIPL